MADEDPLNDLRNNPETGPMSELFAELIELVGSYYGISMREDPHLLFGAISDGVFKQAIDEKDVDASRRAKMMVRRLYNRIEEIETRSREIPTDITTDELLKREFPEIAEQVDPEDWKGPITEELHVTMAEEIHTRLISDYLLLILTVSQVLVEDYCVQLIDERLIEEPYRGSGKTREFLEETLSQPMREQILLRCGIIGGGLHGDMAEVRDTRNEIVHNLRERAVLESVDNSLKTAQQVVRVLDEFEAEVNDGEFKYQPTEED